MKKVLFACALALVAVSGLAQTPSADQLRADQIFAKARKCDVLNQLLPVLMTKAQIKSLLPVLERCRQNVRDTEAKELVVLKKLEAKLDKAIMDGTTRSQVPSRDTMKEIASTYRVLGMIREAVIGENVDSVFSTLDRDLNEGQKKAARNALNPANFDRSIDPKKLTDEKRFKFWIRLIILDPNSYDLLLKLSK